MAGGVGAGGMQNLAGIGVDHDGGVGRIVGRRSGALTVSARGVGWIGGDGNDGDDRGQAQQAPAKPAPGSDTRTQHAGPPSLEAPMPWRR